VDANGVQTILYHKNNIVMKMGCSVLYANFQCSSQYMEESNSHTAEVH
jgi:hypothetical protein